MSPRTWLAFLALFGGCALTACGSNGGSSEFDGGSRASSSQTGLGFGDSGITDFLPDAGAGFPADGGDSGPPCDGGCSLPDATVGYCGDGVLEAGEQCDDGNSKPGDGCSGTCQIEPGWTCPMVDEPCVRDVSATCGNGVLNSGEECDDGNTVSGDGCSNACRIEPGWTCPTVDKPCVELDAARVEPAVCGDGVIESGETCDDGNTVSGDGCSSTCEIEPGYACPTPGQPCVKSPTPLLCGNGVLNPGETCDDGNTVPGDGCSGTCQIEPGWTCPTVDEPCVRITSSCGDGLVEPGEQCDEGTALDGVPDSGCSSICTVDVGYTCTDAGGPGECTPVNLCGNGILDPGEACDTGTNNGTGGCTRSCTEVAGWSCAANSAECTTVCGDGIVAGIEQCDFGSSVNGTASGAACTTKCTIAAGYDCPTTPASSPADCTKTVCGDGKIEGNEECDDGNLEPYDGCSPTCTIEPRCSSGSCTAVCGDGLVEGSELCDDGNTTSGDGCSTTCTIESGWTCVNQPEASPSTLSIPILYRDMHYCNQVGGCPGNTDGFTQQNTVAPFTAANGPAANGHPDFNNDAYNNGGAPSPRTGLVQPLLGADNEPVFKSATGAGSANQMLTGAVAFCWWYHDKGCAAGSTDGGNTPNPYAHLVYLDANGNPTNLVLNQIAGTTTYTYENVAFFPIDGLGWNNPSPNPPAQDPTEGGNPNWYNDPQLTDDQSTYLDGGAYAQSGEPHNFSFTSELHYRFTYQAAANPAPVFTFIGDDDVWAFINGQLVVDLGGMHGHETGTVTLNAAEATTLGLVNGGTYSIDLFQAERHVYASTYGLTLADFVRITSVCTQTPSCGDGIVDQPSEQCDLGSQDNNTTYDGCTTSCQLGPRCGDGVLQDPPEKCDLGAAKNTGGYGGCNPNCTLGPYCGDAILQDPPEQCDYGTAKNTGGYGGCTAQCQLGPYCGDGVVQTQDGEECDDGTPKNTGGYGGCNPNCTLSAHCGDGIVQNPPETCDDGANNQPAATAYGFGLCTTSCTPAPYCGDGVTQAADGEQCDDGANNGAAGDKCDGACKLACGDGIVEPGEQCDDGAANNTGAYGGCNPNCTLAGYCGDRSVQDPPETCDNGANNVPPSMAYGSGVCTTACMPAPSCGDGVVEAEFGEECDSTPGCSSTCQFESGGNPPK
jgi:fibro-slime domain-containing protein